MVLSNEGLARCMDEARDDFALAACLGRIDTVRLLLDAGMRADTLVCDQKSMTLMVARLRGQVDVVELLIECDAALDTVWRPCSRTVLQLASRLSHLSVAKLLLCKRADPHLLDVHGRTALMIASDSGQFGIVSSLLGCWLTRGLGTRRACGRSCGRVLELT